MADRSDEIQTDQEMEETARAQMFSITIVWPAHTEEHLDADELKSLIGDALAEISEDVGVEVSEVESPTY